MNCCPSNLLSGSTLHPYPLSCVKKYTVYTYTYNVREGWVPASDKHLPQSLFTGKSFRWRHLLLLILVSSFYSCIYFSGRAWSDKQPREAYGGVQLLDRQLRPHPLVTKPPPPPQGPPMESPRPHPSPCKPVRLKHNQARNLLFQIREKLPTL